MADNSGVHVAEPRELTHEEVFEALDAWLGSARTCREVKVRSIFLGRVCALYDGGNPVAEERGRHTDSAIENALRKVGAL